MNQWWETGWDPMQTLIQQGQQIQQLDQNMMALVKAHNEVARCLDQQAQLIKDMSKMLVELTNKDTQIRDQKPQ